MQRNLNMQIKYLVVLVYLEVTLKYQLSNILKIWFEAHTFH